MSKKLNYNNYAISQEEETNSIQTFQKYCPFSMNKIIHARPISSMLSTSTHHVH